MFGVREGRRYSSLMPLPWTPTYSLVSTSTDESLFAHRWTIFALPDGLAPTVEMACRPDLVVLDGINDGRGTTSGTFKANGEVTSAHGEFDGVKEGSRMIWRGKILGPARDTACPPPRYRVQGQTPHLPPQIAATDTQACEGGQASVRDRCRDGQNGENLMRLLATPQRVR